MKIHTGHKPLDCQKSQIGSHRCDFNNKDKEITQQSQQSGFYYVHGRGFTPFGPKGQSSGNKEIEITKKCYWIISVFYRSHPVVFCDNIVNLLRQ